MPGKVAWNDNKAEIGGTRMIIIRRTAALFAAVAVLGGCGLSDSALTPSLDGEAPGGAQPAAEQAGAEGQAEAAPAPEARETAQTGQLGGATRGVPALGTTVFEPEELPRFQPTDTFVGQKVQDLRKDLRQLKSDIAQQNQRLQALRQRAIEAARNYHRRLAEMNTRLQIGTTPGNPELVAQWNQAQADLQRVDNVAKEMNALANEAGSTAGLAAFLLDSVQASYSLSGAVERDHEHLAILEDSTNRTVVLIDRLMNELSEDVSRQRSYLERERQNLSALSLAIKNGEFYGESLANRAYGSPRPPASDGSPAAQVGRTQPLVVIRFDGDVQYQQPLYDAVSRTLDRRPNAGFDVVAVAPQTGNQAQTALNRAKARRSAEQVLRSLNEMGLPPNRVSLSATTSADVTTNEVHVYIR